MKVSFTGIGIISAIAASLCCITPVVAFIAGIGGLALTFSWIKPIRPYMIAITILALSFAWYQKIKVSKSIGCDCETNTRHSFWQTKTFLGIITVFVLIMLTFPYYARIFYPVTSKVIVVQSQNLVNQSFSVSGMTCSGCEEHVKHALYKLPGIISIDVFYKTGKVNVQYDKTKTSKKAIITAISSIGYKVKE